MDSDPSEQKVAIITGAAGSIGGEIAEKLDRQDFHLMLVDINQGGLEGLRAKLEGTHESYCSDIRELKNVRNIIAKILETQGRIDVLINNAGVVVTEPFCRCPYEDMERELDVNYRAALYFIRET